MVDLSSPWLTPVIIVTFLLTSVGLGIALRVASRPTAARSRVLAHAGKTLEAEGQPDTSNARLREALRRRERARRWPTLTNWNRRTSEALLVGDVPLRPVEYAAMRVGFGTVLALAAYLLIGHPLIVGGVFIVGSLPPMFWLRWRQQRRRHQVDSQLADTLDLTVNALRSGQTFLRGLQLVAREMPKPISTEAATTIAEIQVGVPLAQALQNLADRSRNDDLGLVVAAVQIQASVGGDLGEVLGNISGTIRERYRIKSEVRALTAQGRLSGWIIGLLPLVLAGALVVLSPGYITPLIGTAIGQGLLGLAVFLWVLGFIVVRRIVTIEY